MTRRTACALLASPALAQSRPRFAITMDDGQWQNIPEAHRTEAEDRLLHCFRKTRAFLFARGGCVDNAHGAHILRQWSSAGHWIGNHTYSHVPLSGGIAPGDFEAEVLHTEVVLQNYSGFRKWFRFPLLKEGKTREVRDRLRSFLVLHGYRNGAVTIDASDWYYDRRLIDHLEADATFELSRFREPYLSHIWERAQFYDQLSRDALGRSVTHTLLVHYNFLNSLFLPDVLAMLQSKGWSHVGADEAYDDPVFRRLPDVAPAGESLVWSLAKETGKFEDRLRYPGEDDIYEKPLLDRIGL